ncbi:MAG: mannose-1-phosphate guanylyltransferase/mannose-6-phosphate isomerase [Alphaproteobacteria bacterium]
MTHPLIVPVVLSGGSGSRLWPLSRASFPKQFLEAPGGKTFLQNTLARVQGFAGSKHLVVACNEAHRFMVMQQADEAGLTPAAVMVEPSVRDTAPAIALIAHYAQAHMPAEALVLVLPSDHLIPDAATFQAMVESAAPLARDGNIVTFGIAPTFPATGYGYIQAGKAMGAGYQVQRFVEKPDAATAAGYLADGTYTWNAGIFLFSPTAFIQALATHAPDLATAVSTAGATLAHDGLFYRPAKDAYTACPKISVDYAVMEPAAAAGTLAMVPFTGQWNDIGNWHAMWEETEQDSNGNAVIGQAMLTDCEGCYVHGNDKTLVAAHGLKNQVIIHTPDATLILPRDKSGDVKDIYKALETAKNPLATTHTTDYRPWGGYTVLADEKDYKAKHIWVKPQGRLSLQSHKHRAEHWVVVSGTATVTRDDETLTVNASESVFLPRGCKHRMENLHPTTMLHLIEVQTGDYFGEDDIVRYEDVYGRS